MFVRRARTGRVPCIFLGRNAPHQHYTSNQGLCSLICIHTTVLWIPEEVGLCSHFDSYQLWNIQDSSGHIATLNCVLILPVLFRLTGTYYSLGWRP